MNDWHLSGGHLELQLLSMSEIGKTTTIIKQTSPHTITRRKRRKKDLKSVALFRIEHASRWNKIHDLPPTSDVTNMFYSRSGWGLGTIGEVQAIKCMAKNGSACLHYQHRHCRHHRPCYRHHSCLSSLFSCILSTCVYTNNVHFCIYAHAGICIRMCKIPSMSSIWAYV